MGNTCIRNANKSDTVEVEGEYVEMYARADTKDETVYAAIGVGEYEEIQSEEIEEIEETGVGEYEEIQCEEIEEEDRAEVLKKCVEKYETEEEGMKLNKNGWCWYKITNTTLVEQIKVQW